MLDAYNADWSDYVSREAWLVRMPWGNGFDVIDINRDMGEDHPSVAMSLMFDDDSIFEELAEYYEAQGDEEAHSVVESMWGREDRAGSFAYLTEYLKIPDEIGARYVGEEVWKDIVEHPHASYALMKHFGAIRVIGNEFQVYKLKDDSLRIIQMYLGQLGEEENIPTNAVVAIEDIEIPSRHKYNRVPLSEFLFMDKPRQFWSYK